MKVALYMRMSTDKQDNSIDSQKQVLVAYANSHNYKITKEYIDEGISGRLAKKRPAFLQMMEDSENNLYNIILIYDSSRFSRNLEEFIVYKSTLKRYGVLLISVTEPIVDDDTSIITDAMLGALNEMYSRKLSKSVKRGMTYKARQGIYQTPPPFGYTKVNNKMNIVKEEAEIVKKIYKMFIDIPTYYSIAVKLNELGITKKNNKPWSSTDISRILKNRGYIGEVHFNKQYYKGNYEPIIDIQTFNKVQQLISLKPKTVKRPSNTYKHWLSGIIKCYQCGGQMNYATEKKGTASYRCSNHRIGKCKYSNYITLNKLEDLIKFTLSDILQRKNLDNYSYFINSATTTEEILQLQKLLNKNLVKLDRCKKAYLDGIDTIEEYKNNKELLGTEKDKLIQQIESLKHLKSEKVNIEKFKNNIKELYLLITDKSFTLEQKSLGIRSVINKIVLNKHNKEFIVYYYL